MADSRYFAKLDLGYFENPKVADLVEERPRVLILHLRAILYSREHLTDGRFPIRTVVRLAYASHCGSQCDGQCDYCAAVDAGLFVRINDRHAEVHDYLEHQDSAAKAAERKAAGQAGAAARWGLSEDANRNAKGNANRNANRNAKGNAEERRGEENKDIAFDSFWAAYPKKVGKGQAVKAWRAAVKKADADVIAAGITAAVAAWKRDGTEQRFIPNPTTWLNGERWADEAGAERDPEDGIWNLPTVEELKARRGF